MMQCIKECVAVILTICFMNDHPLMLMQVCKLHMIRQQQQLLRVPDACMVANVCQKSSHDIHLRPLAQKLAQHSSVSSGAELARSRRSQELASVN